MFTNSLCSAKPFFLGVIESLTAGLLFAWVVYLFRADLNNWFRQRDVTILATIQLAIAPLLIAKADNLAAEHDLILDLDFRYAGRDALESFRQAENGSHRYTFAVASDIALCRFLQQHKEQKIYVLPFVKLTGHLKLIANTDRIRNFDALKQSTGAIGYLDNTVQEHFLRAVGLVTNGNSSRLRKAINIPECLNELKEQRIDAFVLWEPHYIAFDAGAIFNKLFPSISTLSTVAIEPTSDGEHQAEDHAPTGGVPQHLGQHEATDRRILSTCPDNYVWFLCLVAKRSALDEDQKTAAGILHLIQDANARCARELTSGITTIAKRCTDYQLGSTAER